MEQTAPQPETRHANRDVTLVRAVGLGTREAVAAMSLAPRPEALELLLGRVTKTPRRARGGLGHAAAVLAGQVPLVRRRIWVASVVMLTLGAAIAVTRREQGGVVLALAHRWWRRLAWCSSTGPRSIPVPNWRRRRSPPVRLILIAWLANDTAGSGPPSVTRLVGQQAIGVNLLVLVVIGALLTDRWVRDRRLGVEELLSATAASPASRLWGKYLGVLSKLTETGDPVLIRHDAAGYVDEVDVCELTTGRW